MTDTNIDWLAEIEAAKQAAKDAASAQQAEQSLREQKKALTDAFIILMYIDMSKGLMFLEARLEELKLDPSNFMIETGQSRYIASNWIISKDTKNPSDNGKITFAELTDEGKAYALVLANAAN